MQMHVVFTLCIQAMCFLALVTALVLCASYHNFIMSVSVRRVCRVLKSTVFKGGGKPCRKTRETATLRRGIQKAPCTQLDSDPSRWCTSSELLPIELSERPIFPMRIQFMYLFITVILLLCTVRSQQTQFAASV